MVVTKPFNLGQILATPGAIEEMKSAGISPGQLLRRHCALDQGALGAEDHAANLAAVQDGSRIFSAFIYGAARFWVITEAADDNGNRAATTILLPSEY